MALSLRYATSDFSTRVIKRVEVKESPSMALRQFFKEEVVRTRGVKLFIERQGRPVAVSVSMYEKGIVVRRDKSTQKEFIPPFFNYKFDYSALEEFEPVFGATDDRVDSEIYAELVKNTAKGVQENIERFERAEQLQMMNAFETGVVTVFGDSSHADIDFQRKAASIVAYNAAHGWDVDTVNPGDILITGTEFMHKEGKINTRVPINVLVGGSAWEDFKNNPIRQKQGDIKDQKFMDLSNGKPVQDLTPLGSYSAGNYTYNFWGISDYYDHPTTGTTTSLMNEKKIIMLPNSQDFKIVYAGTPGWNGSPYTDRNATPRVIKAKRNFYELRDPENANIQIGVKSAPLAILDKVDNVFTAQVKS